MNLPLFSYEQISGSTHLLLALVIGIAFGFVLEKGGLGDARKLINQFLLKDLAVFKVMFSAIVTAMLGLFFLSAMNIVNLDLIAFPDSYVVPQLLGGLLLGAGFAIAGYCPGTTIVGMASGKLDAFYSFVGLFLGSWGFVLAFNWIETLYHSTHLEVDKLSRLLSLEYGSLVFVLVILAIAGFYAAERLEAPSE